MEAKKEKAVEEVQAEFKRIWQGHIKDLYCLRNAMTAEQMKDLAPQIETCAKVLLGIVDNVTPNVKTRSSSL